MLQCYGAHFCGWEDISSPRVHQSNAAEAIVGEIRNAWKTLRPATLALSEPRLPASALTKEENKRRNLWVSRPRW